MLPVSVTCGAGKQEGTSGIRGCATISGGAGGADVAIATDSLSVIPFNHRDSIDPSPPRLDMYPSSSGGEALEMNHPIAPDPISLAHAADGPE